MTRVWERVLAPSFQTPGNTCGVRELAPAALEFDGGGNLLASLFHQLDSGGSADSCGHCEVKPALRGDVF